MGRRHSNRRPGNSCGTPRHREAGGPDDRPDAKHPRAGQGFRLPGGRPWISQRVCGLAVCGLLLLAVGLAYGQAVGFGFVNLDDDRGVYDNRLVTGELTPRGVLAVFTEHHAESWAPLTCLSHILVWHLLGHGPAVHHLINLLLHAASTVLLLVVLWRMTGRLWPARWWRLSSPSIRSARNRWPG